MGGPVEDKLHETRASSQRDNPKIAYAQDDHSTCEMDSTVGEVVGLRSDRLAVSRTINQEDCMPFVHLNPVRPPVRTRFIVMDLNRGCIHRSPGVNHEFQLRSEARRGMAGLEQVGHIGVISIW